MEGKGYSGENITNPNYSNEPTARYTLEVIPKEVTGRTGSASKTYDGKPLAKDKASITGLVEGENATVRATGSRTKVGKSKNTYSIDWGETDKDNYKVSGKPGTLEVLKAANPLKVKVRAAGNANYKASAWKTVTFKIKLK